MVRERAAAGQSTGKTVAVRPIASFETRFADVPRERARELGRVVLQLPDGEIFEEVESPAPP
jgi:hypothetical protein